MSRLATLTKQQLIDAQIQAKDDRMRADYTESYSKWLREKEDAERRIRAIEAELKRRAAEEEDA